MNPVLERAHFEACLGSTFELVAGDGTPLPVRLVEVVDLGAGRLESFSLMFRGPEAPVLPYDTRGVRHPDLGHLDLFLGPVTTGRTDGVYYQAVFSRLKP